MTSLAFLNYTNLRVAHEKGVWLEIKSQKKFLISEMLKTYIGTKKFSLVSAQIRNTYYCYKICWNSNNRI